MDKRKIDLFLKKHNDFVELIMANIEGHIVKNISAKDILINKEVEGIISKLENIEIDKGYIDRTDVIQAISSQKKSFKSNDLVFKFPKRVITHRTPGQKEYLNALQKADIVIAIGPAGTGKTFLAVANALNELLSRNIRKIILTRPAVEAGEKLGFLPGDLRDKVDPYLRPLYDALYSMLERDRVERFINEEIIEIAPLAYMRGRTLSNSYLILDEAQNTTSKQMKMFITRMGMNSKVIITGDVTQIDLDKNQKSGLIELNELTNNIDGVKSIHLNQDDIVRHPLIKEIINAYNKTTS
ncbi:PhoH family protein [candidate division WOR-3 bacterium]|nr:PhoH family protein [candidate division WOR-3 bacterium]